MNKKSVLDHGYVCLVDVMGSDLSVVNAARCSFDNESKVLTGKDIKLIEYLVKNYHDSPLRHATMTFEIYAPMMIKNQWIKHAVGSAHLENQHGWNEGSRRYITQDPEFYIPDQFSLAPDNLKQGAGELMDFELSEKWKVMLDTWYARGEELYDLAMEDGIAPEQARLFLPAYGLYIKWRWTASLNALLNFLSLRLGEGAQQEIVEYGKVVAEEVAEHFPHTTDAWMKYRV